MNLCANSVLQMIETECFKELNLFSIDGALSPDLIEDQPPPPPRRSFFDRVFRRRRVSIRIVSNLLVVLCFSFNLVHQLEYKSILSPLPKSLLQISN